MGWKVGFLIHKSLFLLFANDRLQTQSARYLQSCFFAAMEIERRWEGKREAGADAENHLFHASLCVTDKAHRKVMLINRSRDEQSYRPLSSVIEKKERERNEAEEREKDWTEEKRWKWTAAECMCCSHYEEKTWISDFYLFIMMRQYCHYLLTIMLFQTQKIFFLL